MSESARSELMRLVNGFQVSQAIHVAAVLGVADLLAAGPQASDALATETNSDADALYRLLRMLASVGVFREEAGRRFSLTDVGACLRSDAAEPVAPWAELVGRLNYWDAWGNLLCSVRSGQTAFRLTHGVNAWEFREAQVDEGRIFDEAMTALSRHVAEAIVAAYDFGRYETIVDVGGGHGVLLAEILRIHPGCRGILYDRPEAVSGAGPVLRQAGVADRCAVVPGDFFSVVPAGGDLYLMKAVLHDWSDADALRLLRACRAAIDAEATLLLVEQVVGEPNRGVVEKTSDINMLVITGGRERTLPEFEGLLARGGFRLCSVTPTTSTLCIIECRPASDGQAAEHRE
jgi:hypothetical protein